MGGDGRRMSSRLRITIDEAEHGNFNEHRTSVLNPKQLTLGLMKRARCLISTIHYSSILDAHVREQMHRKQNDSNQYQSKTDDQVSFKGELVVDFSIR